MSASQARGAAPSAALARNSIGTPHIVFFVVAAAAPLASVVGASPAAFAFGNGAGVPGVYLMAGLLYLVFSVGFTAMSRSAGSAGGFYTYIAKGLGRPAGVAAALVALLTYKMIQLAVYALFGIFVSGALAGLGINMPWWLPTLAIIGLIWLCGARNIAFSGRLLGICMLAEIAILFALDVGILMRGGGPEGITLTSFAPQTVFVPGLGAALVFVVGSFMGFEATAIFSEEAKRPERTIPRATFIAVALIAGFYAFSTWSITQYYGPETAQAAALEGLETFFFVAAADVLGPWSVTTIEILLIVSLFASALSFHNTINRYFFALGREGLLPRSLGSVHDRHGSPHLAGRAQSLIAAALLAAAVVSGLDPYAVVFSWTSAIAVIGILSVQILVSIAIIAWFRRNPAGLGAWTRVAAPVLSVLGLGTGLALVIFNLPLLAGTDSPIIWSFPWLVLAVGLLGATYAAYLRTHRPALYAALGALTEA
ncbi:APC family permease [Paracoccus sp. R12_1]|uniref:APC family permease n=1 Tax=unclassified Paracoccus (in: a-proteobacteria) TaxID=2688777 RepID=UPI001AD9F688|nr:MULTISPECIES: APC family permease [unclassified Paracoccus (in: a-proteobacteria)]MBO9455739.1 APC family permease [Paracoccus sp. R12_2]MBO9487172.1 APC family permease [Paracoccus sp. R12_1]